VFYAGGSNDGFSVATVLNIPLPIELISFEAKEESGTVGLTWITESELNNDFFIVQRSPDGREFNPVVKVSGAGTSNDRHAYYATDSYPYDGISYYRLLQQDFDGTITYSKIIGVSVKANEDRAAHVFPNPVIIRNELYLRYYNQIDETAALTSDNSSFGILNAFTSGTAS
jgi:hypothetical protein